VIDRIRPLTRPLALLAAGLGLLAVGLVTLSSGCGFLRNLDTPRARLVGHWTTNTGAHVFFSPTIGDDGMIIVVPPAGTREEFLYTVIEEDVEEETVTVEVTPEAGGEAETRTYRIPPDGIFMRELTEDVPDEDKTEYIFVDTDVEPPAYIETMAAEATPAQ